MGLPIYGNPYMGYPIYGKSHIWDIPYMGYPINGITHIWDIPYMGYQHFLSQGVAGNSGTGFALNARPAPHIRPKMPI